MHGPGQSHPGRRAAIFRHNHSYSIYVFSRENWPKENCSKTSHCFFFKMEKSQEPKTRSVQENWFRLIYSVQKFENIKWFYLYKMHLYGHLRLQSIQCYKNFYAGRSNMIWRTGRCVMGVNFIFNHLVY